MGDEFSFSAPSKERRRYKPAGKIALFVLGWMLVAGIAFAAFLVQATGTIQVSTTHPASGSLAITSGSSLSFTNTGQTQGAPLDVTIGNTGTVYTKVTTVATSSNATAGCPAGSVTVAGGQVLNFQTAMPASGGTRTTTNDLMATLISSAPQGCADQASIDIPLTVNLTP